MSTARRAPPPTSLPPRNVAYTRGSITRGRAGSRAHENPTVDPRRVKAHGTRVPSWSATGAASRRSPRAVRRVSAPAAPPPPPRAPPPPPPPRRPPGGPRGGGGPGPAPPPPPPHGMGGRHSIRGARGAAAGT